jgi:hypothetical protein
MDGLLGDDFLFAEPAAGVAIRLNFRVRELLGQEGWFLDKERVLLGQWLLDQTQFPKHLFHPPAYHFCIYL